MNPRIKELFKRAGGKTSARNLMSNPVQVVETHELWDDHIEKFAELIVRECMDVAKYHTPDTEECEYTWLIHNNIAKYFGVEE